MARISGSSDTPLARGEWAAQDDRYTPEADHDRNVAAWESFKVGKPGGANYLTLLWEAARARRPDISRRLEPALRFDQHDPVPGEDQRVHLRQGGLLMAKNSEAQAALGQAVTALSSPSHCQS